MPSREAMPESTSTPNWEVAKTSSTAEKSVVVFTEHVNATYYLSFHFAMQSAYWNLHAMSQASASEHSVEALVTRVQELMPDAVIFTRWGTSNGPPLMAALQAAGFKCVYHIDDDLLHLPESLGPGVLATHGSPEVLGARSALLENCDLIYASTAPLATNLRHYFPNQQIYSGIYAPVLQSSTYAAPAHDGFEIGYMGSKGHVNDLAMVVPALERILSADPAVKFTTFGTIPMPEPLAKFTSQISHIKVKQNYMDFIEQLATLSWDIGLAPLENVEFNRCKAPTKFIEYTSSGIPVVASRINVYEQHLGADRGWLSADDGWYEAIAAAMSSGREREHRHKQAAAYTQERFTLELLDIQLQGVIATLNEHQD